MVRARGGRAVDVVWISLRTVRVTGTALAVAAVIGVPLGAWLGLARYRARIGVATIVNAGMGLPPTVAGLAVFWAVSRTGPLGLGWGCTVPAMVAAQVVIATPIVAGLVMAALLALPRDVHVQARAIGARGVRLARVLLRETRIGVLAAFAAAYGGIVSEVGAALMTGCNLHGRGVDTRLLTTAMVEEVRRGDLGAALGLGAVLLGIVLAVSAVLTWSQHRATGSWFAPPRSGRG